MASDRHRGFCLDAAPRNADWTKRHWDIHGTPEFQASVILSGAKTPEDRQRTLDGFMKLPAAIEMPAATRMALRRLGLKL